MAFADGQTEATILAARGEAKIVLAGTITKGDAVGYDDGWKRTLATVGTVIPQRCIAGESGVEGQEILAYFEYAILGGDRFTGATAGNPIYVAEGTDNGEYTETPPSDVGDINTIVGYAVEATILAIYPNANNDRLAT